MWTLTEEEAAYILLELSKHDKKQSPKEEVPLQASEAHQTQSKKRKADKNQYPKLQNKSTTRKHVEEDDSEETLIKLLEWNEIKPDPREIFTDAADMVERFSEPIKKQLRESDVKEDQSRLMLGKMEVKNTMFPLLKKSELPLGTEGLDVSVYGPDGEVQEMKFKMWSEDTPVLTSGWKEFVAKYDLKKHCDFPTIWMFRHRETRKICFAIESTRFSSITKPLSRRIFKAVFKNQN